MSKDTVASYNLDFKFKYDGAEYNLRNFVRHYHYTTGICTGLSTFDWDILIKKFGKDSDMTDKYNSFGFACENKLEAIKDHPAYVEAEKSFDAWAKKRTGVKRTFESCYDGTQKTYWGDTIKHKEFNLINVANSFDDKHFKKMLEKNRPTKINVGDMVVLSDKAPKTTYDPFLWDPDNQNKPRIGVICRNTEETSYRSGKGSLLLNVMWFASGNMSKVPIRHLRKHVAESET